VTILEHALPVLQAMVKTLKVSAPLVPLDVPPVTILEHLQYVLHVLLLAISTTALPKHASLAVLAVIPVPPLMERLSYVPNVTTTIFMFLLLLPAKLAILANTS